MMCTRATMARPVPHKIKNKREEKQKPYALLKLKYSTNIYIYILDHAMLVLPVSSFSS